MEAERKVREGSAAATVTGDTEDGPLAPPRAPLQGHGSVSRSLTSADSRLGDT